MARKNACPSDTCPAYPVTRFSPIAPIDATHAVASTTSRSSVSRNGNDTAAIASTDVQNRFPGVFSKAVSCL